MMSFFLNVSFSDVKKLGVIAIGMTASFLAPSLSSAQTPAPTCSSAPEPKNSCGTGKIWKAVNKPCPSGGVFTESWECVADTGNCESYKKEIEEAQADAVDACNQAGLGSYPTCVGKMKSCMDDSTAKDTDPDWWSQLSPLASQLGTQMLGSDPFSMLNKDNKPKAKGSCPNMSHRDYLDNKERIQRSISEKQKDVANLQEEIADATKDFNEQKEQLMKDVNETQKELNEQTLDLSKQARETQAELVKSQNEAAEQIRRLNTQLMQRRNQMAQTDALYLQKLNQLTQKMGESHCMLKVQEKRAELQKAGVFGTSGGGVGAMGRQSSKSSILQEMWDICLRDFNQQRRNAQDERSAALQSAQNDIKNIQENINEANHSLETIGKQIQSALAEIDTSKNNKAAEAVRASQTAQQALADATTNLKSRQDSISAQQNSLTAEINTLNQDLANLGPEPSSGATNGWREAQSKLIRYRSKIVALPESCQEQLKDKQSDLNQLNNILEGKKVRTRRTTPSNSNTQK